MWWPLLILYVLTRATLAAPFTVDNGLCCVLSMAHASAHTGTPNHRLHSGSRRQLRCAASQGEGADGEGSCCAHSKKTFASSLVAELLCAGDPLGVNLVSIEAISGLVLQPDAVRALGALAVAVT
jgi:hypothetical protein